MQEPTWNNKADLTEAELVMSCCASWTYDYSGPDASALSGEACL
jgi:hypothetical protein